MFGPISAHILYVLYLCHTWVWGETLYRRELTEEDGPYAVCNDGTPAVYYHSDDAPGRRYDRVVIYLQGGYFCDSKESCIQRCQVEESPLCSTSRLPTMQGRGVLSDSDNEYLAYYYKVSLHYCTSDQHFGDREASEDTGGYHLCGRRVFDALVASLVQNTELGQPGSEVILTGTSAGGRGAAFNCDHLQYLLPEAQVKCIIDATIFYPEIQPFDPKCRFINDVIRDANDFYHGDVTDFDIDTWWKTFKLPLFIGIHMYDTFALDTYYCARNDTDVLTWGEGVVAVSQSLAASRPDVGLWVPGCTGHGLITINFWYSSVLVGADNLSYQQAIVNWLTGAQPYQVWDVCGHNCNPACL